MARVFERVLVANRGEIARRIFRTLRAMGIASVAVYSDADADAPHVAEADEAVRVGAAPSRESYLAIARILAAAEQVGADAVHPGYGFLSENAEFAARCGEKGIAFIGPTVDAIRRMSSKIEAKAIMAAAGVPVVPGTSGAGLADEALVAAAGALGLPLLIKASAGGGGKGMRIVRDLAVLPDALAAARREAASAFGNDTLLLERYFEAPRHVEIQIFGDTQGTVVHCFERECSIQRRYQKIIEEAPSPALDAHLRARMAAAAVAAGKAIGYVGAGTVEFILDAAGAFYFLEVNTRLQVEHPVTEAITSLDLVRWQILIAQGEPIPVVQDALAITGHAIEARLYAEDPANDFLPAHGRIAIWDPPELPGLRYDSGVARDTTVGIHYDPLLAKIIAHGATRAQAIARLVHALRCLGVAGVTTNRDLLLAVLTHPAFGAGALDTHFIDRHLPPTARVASRDAVADRTHAIVAALAAHERRRRAGGPLPASIPSGWRNNRWRPQEQTFRVGDETIAVRYVPTRPGEFDVEATSATTQARVVVADEREIVVELDGVRRRFTVAIDDGTTFVHGPLGTAALVAVPRFPPARREEIAGGCLAPMPGVIRQVRVAAGDRVEKGTIMLVLEAMKMEHQMIAADAGTVKEVRVEVGEMVDPDTVMIVVDADV
ncbi:MAG: ATP-grasp domain-containing protein [Deltaproteobacteria bacterium]|nr:ATP-grasp domain-containing protein [Deltaproteobacteria bacterium]